MFGKPSGASQGKGGSMHFYKSQNNFFGGNGIVGDQVSLGTGFGFALKYQKNKQNVGVSVYGDGAANQGQLYESANIAQLHKFPMLYICENNRYAMGTSVERASAGGGNFHAKLTWNHGIQFEAHCVFETREAVRWAKKFALQNGPIFLNAQTYRYHGHSMSDPGITYRNRDEVQEVRKNKDPILLMKQYILEHKVASEEELRGIENEIKSKLEEDAEKAFKGPNCDMESLTKDVYTSDMKHYLRAPNYDESVFAAEKLIQ